MKLNKTLLAITLAATTTMGIFGNASACSRLVVETDHGTLLSRTADWVSSSPFDAKVAVYPVGSERIMRGDAKAYKATLRTWTTQYHTVSFEEWGAFAGLSGQTVNEHGLSAMLLSQHDSEPFIADHVKNHDNGAPAINLADLPAYVAENFKTTQEVYDALQQAEFQIAWSSEVANTGVTAPLHFSTVDAQGNIMLIQLNEGGEERIFRGDKHSDLRVKTNDPLQQVQREYVKQFAIDDANVLPTIPHSIDGKSRNARLLALDSHNSYTDMPYYQAVGMFKTNFESQAVVPFGLNDPHTGEDYPTFFTMTFNLDNGDIWFKSQISAQEVKFTMDDTKKFDAPMRADIQATTDQGLDINWTKMK